ncbi:NYN domain-containing protein [Bradyrhizobium sp. CCGUVB23]|uniref:NYN domain-containing protein n=1 Tax=unclassified Bradyrhizobium TaxID=2631580 RepID=UPI0020B2705B|nr:NYN domain-containing protein [Bradyrhizobium sp. CCGUVB23]MCP3468183.1 NYN domain-containing protein [Bradyrhizobium sp. CCGUVB23]
MTTYTYVDNSNLYIEGTRVSAVKKGMAKNIVDAMNKGVVDHGWVLDYGKLYKYVSGEDTVAKLWGSPPPGDSFWKMVGKAGFKTQVYNKNAGNKEKKVDVAIATAMMDDAFNVIDKDNDDILLVAGDSDYVPVVAKLIERGFKVEVAFWGQAAKELRDTAANFFELDGKLDEFTRAASPAAA